MRFLLVAFMLFMFTPAQCQINTEKPEVQTIAYWLKNDSLTYEANYIFHVLNQGDTLKTLNRKNDLFFKVIDSTAHSYDVILTYHPTSFDDTLLKEPFIIKFRTDEMGTYQEWLNPEEVIQAIKKNNFPDHCTLDYEFVKQLINHSTSNHLFAVLPLIENILLRDVFTFLYFHGGVYPTDAPTWGTIHEDNPITNKPVEATVYITVDEINTENNYYIVSTTHKTSRQHMKTLLQDDLKIVNDATSTFSNDIYSTSVLHESGWPMYLESYSELIIGENSHVKWQSISLKNPD